MSWESGEPVLGPLFSGHLVKRLGQAREPRSAIEARHENLAATLQARAEEVILETMTGLSETTGLNSLAYAGGVAFNCVANGKATEQTPINNYYIQSAAGDAGLAIGAAYYVWHQLLGHPRDFVMDHSYWGPAFGEPEIRQALESHGLSFSRFEPEQLTEKVAKHVSDGEVVGWFQGRTEWGPRALGNRSIVADPRRTDMRDILNKRIKLREPFRPFAPSVLEERMGEWYEGTHPSPFMLMAYRVRPEKRDLIPAPTHVDGTGRLQTVNRSTNPLYWGLIHEFEKLTGVPVVLNTSFNENEPVVNTPDEAIKCFLRTQMDTLAIGPFVTEKAQARTPSND
jgi:carbamoyltransferase